MAAAECPKRDLSRGHEDGIESGGIFARWLARALVQVGNPPDFGISERNQTPVFVGDVCSSLRTPVAGGFCRSTELRKNIPANF